VGDIITEKLYIKSFFCTENLSVTGNSRYAALCFRWWHKV